MHISPEFKKEVLSRVKVLDIVNVFSTTTKRGSSYTATCPMCQAEAKKGLQVSISKNMAKCFSCDFGFNADSIIEKYLINLHGKSFPEAVKFLADTYNVILPDNKPEQKPRTKGPQRKTGDMPTFRDAQLKLSGLTDTDQKATVYIDNETRKVVDVFEAGTLDEYGRITSGDDMIIWYYDLEGRQVTYQKPKSQKYEPFFRVRWQNPALHTDKAGNPMKYKSPYGAGSQLYIPEAVRQAYADGRTIKRLYLQEGEKKAEKSCKHGIFSVGLAGIHNLGHEKQLPYALQQIIKRCKIEEVCFLLDSDWNDLSDNLSIDKRTDQRPYSFFYAIKNYRDYFRTFASLNIYIEIYFATLRKNEANDKGIDDLLTNSLATREDELRTDFDTCIASKDGLGQYVDVYRITTWSEGKLLELWSLQTAEAFAYLHRERLKQLPEFIIGRHKWRFDEQGQLILAQPLTDDERFWEEVIYYDKHGEPRTDYKFDYENVYNFFRNRGYGRLMMAGNSYSFIHTQGHIISMIEAFNMKDYLIEIARDICPKEIRNMLYRGGKNYLGPDSLSNLPYLNPEFYRSEKESQLMFFKDKFWKITADAIQEFPLTQMEAYIWQDQIIDFDATLLNDPMVTFKKITPELAGSNRQLINHYEVNATQLAEQCHFHKFLWFTSEFNWNKFLYDNHTAKPSDERTLLEQFETATHYISKCTAMGYLLHTFRDPSIERGIIGMDGKLSEVGESYGRTGKSIIGEALKNMLPTIQISGKARNLTEDPFIFEEVTEKTKLLFIDDTRVNIDFEFFFPVITGIMTINVKGKKKFTLTGNSVPKLYITTNHAINGSSDSFRDRQGFMVFSDWYNKDHKPTKDFGTLFFKEWEAEQWNLFYNFMARCLQMYFIAKQNGWGVVGSGLVQPNMERIEMRRLRQEIGEVFITWADEYYNLGDEVNPRTINEGRLGARIERKTMYDDFIDKNPAQKQRSTPHSFSKKLKFYAMYRNLVVNPDNLDANGLPGASDKSGGVEYFTLKAR